MAELEVAKNLKKAIEMAKSSQHSQIHKLKEVAFEIIIIVFAVSLSIYLHTWSEHREEKHQASMFLNGLSNDLLKDIEEMQSDLEAFRQQKILFTYISQLPNNAIANADSIAKYHSYLFSYTGLGKNNGRYEGFKSSGKLQYIENQSILNLILDYYEESIPLLKISTEYYKNQKTKLSDFVIDNSIDYPQGNLMKVLASEQIKNRCRIYLSSVDQIISSYEKCIDNCHQIIEDIGKEAH
ncbi:MAG: hypothetical protein LC105_13190 [Chitinophagales bacterium]|nr:hypothetical protein [Chitinophagales bacterium]MCZ2394811.1 hypothetical protein [Chitinophagales bacterium]